MHLNRLGKERGRCCAEKKIEFRAVDDKTRQRLLAPLSEKQRLAAFKRKAIIFPCSCPYYHEIELGQVHVLKPGDVETVSNPNAPGWRKV
jgi:hypothetical protein